MKQIFLSKKGIEVLDVPSPKIGNKELLVNNHFSCISPGTELSGIKSIQQGVLTRILKKPEALRNLFNTFIKSGLKNTTRVVKRKLNTYFELGYSSSGIVEEVGKDIHNFKKGDFVACSGGGYASHAEKITVPENLAVKVSNLKNLNYYSSVALGAISLQSIRRLSPSIGETFVVVGLGFIGQITMQILAANGAKVLGIDPNKDFVEKAKENGFDNSFLTFDELIKKTPVYLLENGLDGAIITASSKSNEIISNSFKICRKKSRVVVVGDVGLSIKREDIYKKEIDFFISTSYGPGRYDDQYEREGMNIPKEYIRWTLNRNMETYIDLIDNKKINLSNLMDKVDKIDNAKKLYDTFTKTKRPISAIIQYQKKKKNFELKDKNPSIIEKNKFVSAVIGVGGFSQEILIPNLIKLKKINSINTLCLRRPISVLNARRNYKDIYITNNYDQILENKNINVIFITTRHNLHFPMIIKALKAGKNVFCEKPLCITKKELSSIKNFFLKTSKQVIVTGFNRRFSGFTEIMKKFIEDQNNPVFLNYTVNADQLDKTSWVYTKEGGGRNIGEACHFYDLILYLIDEKYIEVNANAMFDKRNSKSNKTDNFFVQIKFSNGSIAQINYSTTGAKPSYKELIEIRGLNKTLINKDFKQIKILENSKEKILYSISKPDKGYLNQYDSFFRALKKGKSSIPLQDQINAMDICFIVEDQI